MFIIVRRIIVTGFGGLQQVLYGYFEQVKAGVAFGASPANHIGRQSRPFRCYLSICLGGLLKGHPDLEVFMKKERFNTYLDEELSKKMTAAMELSDVSSRNAVEFYVGYIFMNKSSDFLAPVITDTMKEIQSDYERRVSEMLFKVAVEVSKTNRVLTDYFRFPKDYLKGFTASVAQEVAETNGIIHIEDRAKYTVNHAETDY